MITNETVYLPACHLARASHCFAKNIGKAKALQFPWHPRLLWIIAEDEGTPTWGLPHDVSQVEAQPLHYCSPTIVGGREHCDHAYSGKALNAILHTLVSSNNEVQAIVLQTRVIMLV